MYVYETGPSGALFFREKRFMELDMTKGSPSKLITKFIIPIIIGNIFQQLYSMVAVSYTHLTLPTICSV